uniref:Ribosome biogenesis regulatory protein homolog n=1 Tax=Acrobeloides nanus TaxID=290746 RepID=A0A914BZB6_9BILA
MSVGQNVIEHPVKVAKVPSAQIVYKPTEVKKLVEPIVDTANLLFIDRDPDEEIEEAKNGKKPSKQKLLELARDNTQFLFNKIWELPRERVEDAFCAVLPSPEYALPREKPLPTKREPTKWEKFAQAKGIKKQPRNNKTYDEATKEWKPTYGYRRANDETKDWLIEIPENKDPYKDYFGERQEAKKERVAKNKLQNLKNIARNMKKNEEVPLPLGVGVEADAHSKKELTHQIYRAKVATASAGKFQPDIKGEKTPKLGKKRQFAPNEQGTADERKRQLEILEKIETKKPKLIDSRLAASQVGVQEQEGNRGENDKKKKKGEFRSKSNMHRQQHFQQNKKGGFKSNQRGGFYLNLENGFSANIFLGIPFARPPIGEYRFEDRFKEDYPVLVWIHGGRFSTGGAEKYGYKTLVENFVSQGIIVVTLQYRLGPFGFLSFSDDFNNVEPKRDHELPGNLGLYDIQAALLFLIENIEHFGGNSFDITLMGKGSGSASIEALTISPKTDYLFQKTVELSNPTHAFQWVNAPDILSLSKDLVKYVGCGEDNDTALIKKCLKNVTLEKIYQGQQYLSNFDGGYSVYGPMINFDFFDGRFKPTKQYKKFSLTGLSNMDFLLHALISMSPEYLASIGLHKKMPEEFGGDYNEDELLEAIFYMDLFREKYPQEFEKAYDSDYQSYPSDLKLALSRSLFEKGFMYNVILNTQVRADWHWPNYFFYLNNTNVTEDIELSAKENIHADMQSYLFGIYSFGQFEFNENDKQLKKVLVDVITSFVKTKYAFVQKFYTARFYQPFN